MRSITKFLLAFFVVLSSNLVLAQSSVIAIKNFNRGNGWFSKGDYDKAISYYSEALNIDPKYTDAYIHRGIAWTKKSNFDKAIADYDEAIKIYPQHTEAYINRATAWYSKQDFDKAIADYSEAIKIDPKDAYVYADRGRTWIKKGNFEKALLDYNESIKINPQYASAYIDRGRVWIEMGDFDRAIADYGEALRINPQFIDAKENLELAQVKKIRLKEQVQSANLGVESKFKRVALIIGNSAYVSVGRLDNPTRDATLMSKTLKEIGFDYVNLALDLSRENMIQKLSEFEQIASNADESLIYYAGHGIEVNGINYVIPVDLRGLQEHAISHGTVNMEYLLNSAEAAKKMRLVIIDACRDNPFEIAPVASSGTRGLSAVGAIKGRGLARVEPLPGTLVVYATKHGQVALDGDGNNSPFAEALAKRILQKPALEVRRLFDYVREDVFEATNKAQQPFSYGSLSAKDDFYFRK